jgi:hypothetical protein
LANSGTDKEEPPRIRLVSEYRVIRAEPCWALLALCAAHWFHGDGGSPGHGETLYHCSSSHKRTFLGSQEAPMEKHEKLRLSVVMLTRLAVQTPTG